MVYPTQQRDGVNETETREVTMCKYAFWQGSKEMIAAVVAELAKHDVMAKPVLFKRQWRVQVFNVVESAVDAAMKAAKLVD